MLELLGAAALLLLVLAIPLLLVLPLNVNAQLPFLPSGNLTHLPSVVQPTTNLTNSTSTLTAPINMTAIGEQVMLNTTALTNLSNDLGTGNLTPDDLKNQKAICAYENKTNFAAAMLTGCTH